MHKFSWEPLAQQVLARHNYNCVVHPNKVQVKFRGFADLYIVKKDKAYSVMDKTNKIIKVISDISDLLSVLSHQKKLVDHMLRSDQPF